MKTVDAPPSQETPSLVKRLAGPSTGKAGSETTPSILTFSLHSPFGGRLAQDQGQINRIIADASKGSKFYEAWFSWEVTSFWPGPELCT